MQSFNLKALRDEGRVTYMNEPPVIIKLRHEVTAIEKKVAAYN